MLCRGFFWSWPYLGVRFIGYFSNIHETRSWSILIKWIDLLLINYYQCLWLIKLLNGINYLLQNPRFSSSRSSLSPHYISRSKGVRNWVSGGHGMQAIFLDSSQKPRGGTGVFLPQRAGTNFHPKKKPGTDIYSPKSCHARIFQHLYSARKIDLTVVKI